MTKTIEKTRPDGTKVRIAATLNIPYMGGLNWQINVRVCQPKKRTWVGVYSSDDYEFRINSGKDRENYILSKQLDFCTFGEMLEAKMEVWQALRPSL